MARSKNSRIRYLFFIYIILGVLSFVSQSQAFFGRFSLFSRARAKPSLNLGLRQKFSNLRWFQSPRKTGLNFQVQNEPLFLSKFHSVEKGLFTLKDRKPVLEFLQKQKDDAYRIYRTVNKNLSFPENSFQSAQLLQEYVLEKLDLINHFLINRRDSREDISLLKNELYGLLERLQSNPLYRGGMARSIIISDNQLDKKFKHASDFGIQGDKSPETLQEFEQAIEAHIKDPSVQVIQGVYWDKLVVFYLNPKNSLCVFKTIHGVFISGWKLNPAQLKMVLDQGEEFDNPVP